MSSSTTHPVCAVCPSGKLNKDNIATLVLPSHRRFVETAQLGAPAPSSKSPSPSPSPPSIINSDAAWVPHSKPQAGPSNPGKHRPHVSDSSTSYDDVSNGNAESPTPTTSSPKAKHPKKKKKKEENNPWHVLYYYIGFCGVNHDI